MAIKTQTVESNQNNFTTIAKATALGGVGGYALKWVYPLTSDEKDDEFRAVINIIKKESKKAKHKAIEDIRKIPQKTLAQDTFIKIVDSNEALKKAKPTANVVENTYKMLQKAHLTDTDKIQFNNIISAVQSRSHNFCKQCTNAFERVTKAKRSTPWFIAAGAVAGFVAGLGNNILKSDT